MFTETEASFLRLYLGYADLYRFKNTRLESIISGDVISPDTEALVRLQMQNVQVVDDFILQSIGTAGIKRVDDVEFFASRAMNELYDKGRVYIGRISVSLGVPIANDYYGQQGYAGDQYSSLGGLGNGSATRIFRLG